MRPTTTRFLSIRYSFRCWLCLRRGTIVQKCSTILCKKKFKVNFNHFLLNLFYLLLHLMAAVGRCQIDYQFELASCVCDVLLLELSLLGWISPRQALIGVHGEIDPTNGQQDAPSNSFEQLEKLQAINYRPTSNKKNYTHNSCNDQPANRALTSYRCSCNSRNQI